MARRCQALRLDPISGTMCVIETYKNVPAEKAKATGNKPSFKLEPQYTIKAIKKVATGVVEANNKT